MRILVVDDNADNAEMLVTMLRLSGHQTARAGSGPEAIKSAAVFHPHVILLDIGPPGMSGYEVVRELRRQPWTDAIVIVAVTGWGQIADKQRAFEAGFDIHLTKPVDPDALERILGEVARRVLEQPHSSTPFDQDRTS